MTVPVVEWRRTHHGREEPLLSVARHDVRGRRLVRQRALAEQELVARQAVAVVRRGHPHRYALLARLEGAVLVYEVHDGVGEEVLLDARVALAEEEERDLRSLAEMNERKRRRRISVS